MFSVLLPAPVVGAVTFVALLATTIAAFVMLIPGIVLKLIPWTPLQRACSRYCVWIAINWVSNNKIVFRLLHAVQWNIDIRTAIQPGKNYLLIANHQSWADILLVFDLCHLRSPFPRFFLKQELMYVPIIGVACWAMDFPFMKRHSREALAANPALRNEDIEATRKACELYRSEPVTVVNFLEGTRFSEAKRVQNKSPYRHLLRPKAAGMSFTLNTMGDQFAGVIDATICYQPTKKPLLWSFCCGEQDQLSVHIDVLPIPQELISGDYEHDPAFRARFQSWVNGIWMRKDARLERMLNTRPAMQTQRPAHY